MNLRTCGIATLAVAALSTLACGSKTASDQGQSNGTSTPVASAPGSTAPDAPMSSQTRVEMKKVSLDDDVSGTIRVQWMNGLVSPARKGGTISLDDKQSFLIDIQNGLLSTSLADMTRLMNQRIFSYPGSPLSNLLLTAQGSQLKLNGTVKKGLSFPVEIISDVGTTPKGEMKLHIESVKALKVPVKGVLGLFGVKVGDLVDARGAKGVTVDGNDMILDISQLLPPPKKRGRIAKVEVVSNDLVLTFGSGPFQQTSTHPGYLKLQGGAIEFGKLHMKDADLTLSDPTSPDWFDFSIDHYQRQLVAGYSKITPSNALESLIPGYQTVLKAAPAKARP